MRKNIFSLLAPLNASLFAFSILFILAFPSLQLTSSINTESVKTEYGENFPWKIENGETIYTISEKWYGDRMFWTTIMYDNPWIENPTQLETGWVLEMRYDKPIVPAPVKPEFEAMLGTTRVIAYAAPMAVTSATYSGGPLNEAQIAFLGQCESGMTATRNSGNGYYGAFQFSPSTWNSMGTGYARADMAPIEVQKEAVQKLLSRSSIFGQFPGCARKMQATGML